MLLLAHNPHGGEQLKDVARLASALVLSALSDLPSGPAIVGTLVAVALVLSRVRTSG